MVGVTGAIYTLTDNLVAAAVLGGACGIIISIHSAIGIISAAIESQ
jgi:hypothetical protein